MSTCSKKKLTRLVLTALLSTGGGLLAFGNQAEAETKTQITTQAEANPYNGDGGADLTINGQDDGFGNWTAINATTDINIGLNTAGNAPNGKTLIINGVINDGGNQVNLGLGAGSTWYIKGEAGSYPFSSVNNLYLDGGVIDAATYCDGRANINVANLYGTGTFYTVGEIVANAFDPTGYLFEGSSMSIATMQPGAVLNVGVAVRNSEIPASFGCDPVVTSPGGSGTHFSIGGNIKAVPFVYGSKTYTAVLEAKDDPYGDGVFDSGVLVKSFNTDSTTANENTMTAADSKFALNSLFLAETNNLQKRMGELRGLKPAESGAWARFGHGDLKPSDGRAAEAKYNMVQVGYDWDKKLADGIQYQGFAVSHMSGSSWFEQGTGELRETTLSLYRTWIGKRGHYYDVIAKVGEYSDDYKVWPNLGDDAYAEASSRTWAYSIGGEYGYRQALPNNTYVEPSGELILGRMNGVGYTIQDEDAHVDAMNHAIVRLGATYGANLAGDKANVYLKANYFHDFGGGFDVRYGDTAYNRDGVRNWWEFAVGGNVKAGDNCNVYAELAKNIGDLRSDVKVNLGVRVSF